MGSSCARNVRLDHNGRSKAAPECRSTVVQCKWGPGTVQHEGRTEITAATNEKRNNQNQTGISRLIYTEGTKKRRLEGKKWEEVSGQNIPGGDFVLLAAPREIMHRSHLVPVFRGLILR